MAEFVLLFQQGRQLTNPSDMQAHMQKWMTWSKDLREKGVMKSGEPLERSGKTVSSSKKTVTDGPLAEAKDLVVGFMVIAARDLAHATEVAQGCPILELDGSVQVRPVMPRTM